MPKLDRERFEANPNLFLETVIKEYVATSPTNRLPAYNNEPIVDEPLVGFANGNNPIFHEYKNEAIIGDFHLTPAEALPIYLRRQNRNGGKKKASVLNVISVVFTDTYNTRLSNRPESVMASTRWQYAYNRGITFMRKTLGHVASLLAALGYQAVAPICTEHKVYVWLPARGLLSDWSEKHIAYAAGLGTFGLNSGFITRRGAAVHCGSVITDLALTPTPRVYDNPHGNCLYYRNGSCKRCIQRCPSGALSEQGHNMERCFFYHRVDLIRISKDLGREAEQGDHPVCALCQTKVPCEGGIPPDTSVKNRQEQKP